LQLAAVWAVGLTAGMEVGAADGEPIVGV